MEEIQQTHINSDRKKYTVVDFLGQGQYGKVQKVIDHDQNMYALKEQEDFRPVEKEFIDKIQSKGDGLLKIYETFSQKGKFYIVQEYCNRGSLEKYLKKKGLLEIKEAQKILLQLSKQLSIIHSMGYIFQDLKPENIVIKEINNKLKYYLCDFGSVIKINNNIEDIQFTQSRLGTPYYMAPESMNLTNQLDQSIDIWALGVLYYELIQGKKFFDGNNNQQIFKQIKQVKQDELNKTFITILKIDMEKDQILLSMLDHKQKNRPNIVQVINYFLTQQKKLLKQELKLQDELFQKNESYKLLIIKYQQLEIDWNTKYEQLQSESQEKDSKNKELQNKILQLEADSKKQYKNPKGRQDKLDKDSKEKLSQMDNKQKEQLVLKFQ